MKRERGFILNGERYAFDFGKCSYANGYAQVDTSQDAPYYGIWTNPTELTILSYCEGDVTTETAENVAEYVIAIQKLKAWHEDNGIRFIGIDALADNDLKARFTEIGLADLLH